MAILRAKVQAPLVPAHVIERPRLLDSIARGRERLVVLEAPGGFGKSVLAAQVHARAPRATAWLHLDPDDTDPARFSRYVVASLAEILPAISRTELTAATEQPGFDVAAWADDLVLFLDEVAKRRVRLVLDNFESIIEGPAPLVWLQRMLDAAPHGLSLLIATRRPIPLKVQRLIASGDVSVIRQDQLTLSLDEYREAVAARGLAAAESDVVQRWERTQGWAVMLGLDPNVAAGGAYVEEEILPDVPGKLRTFLTETSPFEVLSARVAEVYGYTPQQYEEHAAQMSSRAIPHLLLESGAALRVHPVLRERLMSDLCKTPAGRESAVQAARWYAHAGQFEQARRVLVEADRKEDLLAMLEEEWDAIDRSSMHARVEEWLEELAAEYRFHPHYAAAMARILRMAGQPRRLVEYMTDLRRSGALIETWEGYPHLWAVEAWAKALLESGSVYERLEREWDAMRGGARSAHVVTAEHFLGVLATYELRFKLAERHARQAMAHVPRESFTMWANEQNLLAVVMEESGRWNEGVALREEAIARSASAGDTIHLEINVAGLAWAWKELGRYDEALRALQRAADMGERMGGTRALIRPHLMRTRGEIYWHTSRRKEGIAELMRAFEAFKDVNRLERVGTGVTIDHWRACMGETSELIGDEDLAGLEVSEPHVRYLIRRARQAIERGDFDTAGERLERAESLSRDMLGWQVTVNLHQGLLHSRRGDARSSAGPLRTALQKLDEIGAGNYAMADPWLTAWAVTEATAGGIESARVSALVQGSVALELGEAFRERLLHASTTDEEAARLVAAALRWRIRGLDTAVTGAPVVAADLRTAYLDMLDHAPLPELRVQMLGPWSVAAAGREVRFTRKASRGILEMLLLDYPRPVHEEQLLEALWPDAEPAAAKRSLQTAVNDLRKSLDPFMRPSGPSYVRFRDEHYVLELPDRSNVDYHEFRERVAELVPRLRAHGRPPDREALQRALELYRGELLEHAPYADYVVEHRERARSAFLEGIAALAEDVATSNPASASRLLERGLEADPFWAEGLAMLMDCLRRQDRVLAALRLYRDYERRLGKDLGAEPDPQLREVFEGLTRA